MIYGIGTDIIQLKRINHSSVGSDKLAKRILTDAELDEWQSCKQSDTYLAKKFAAKEAIVKALGTGIGNGISWKMMQIEHDSLGKPMVVFFDHMAELIDTLNIQKCHLSISDEREYAVATAIMEC